MNNNELRSWGHALRDRLGLQEFDLWLNRNGDIDLQMIAVPRDERKQGLGSRALQELCDLADDLGLRIVLDLGQKNKEWGTTSKTRLIEFYKRFGFKRNFSKTKDYSISSDMYRLPKRKIMEKITFKEFLLREAPIDDYKLIGKWDRGSSFTDKRDRMILQHPKAIERTKKKFAATDYVFNLYFVNSKEARKHTEVGEVTLQWVRQNLGDQVASSIKESEDAITIIFTNNKGAERMNMTAWIIAHRMGHAFARKSNMREIHGAYTDASNALISFFAEAVDEFYLGRKIQARSERELTRRGEYMSTYNNSRRNQLAMLSFFYEVATFKSARDRNIRDWFEVLNELIAQYLTTGKIKFNKPPQSFRGGSSNNRFSYHIKSEEAYQEAVEHIEMMERDMQYYIESILNSSLNKIFVM